MRTAAPLAVLALSCSGHVVPDGVPTQVVCEKVACARYYKINGTQVAFEGITVPVGGQVIEVGATDIRPELLVDPSSEMLLLDQSQYALCQSANAVRRQPSTCQETQKEYRDAVYALVSAATAKEVQTWYRDLDGDGHGDPTSTKLGLGRPNGYVDNPRDCVDTDADIRADATETCNGLDDDCDGRIDTDAADAQTWFPDTDGDTRGSACAAVSTCAAPAGHVANADDPDDADPAVTAYAAGVSLFADVALGGESEIFGPGDHGDLRSSPLHDRASSVRVPVGYEVLACEDIGFTGACSTFLADQAELRRSVTTIGNDAVSSIRVSRRCEVPDARVGGTTGL